MDKQVEQMISINKQAFEQELVALINRYSAENGSNTPDYILASYLIGCLEQFEKAASSRDEWYGSRNRVSPDFVTISSGIKGFDDR